MQETENIQKPQESLEETSSSFEPKLIEAPKKTNRVFLIVLIIIAIIVGVGLWWWAKQIQKGISVSTQTPSLETSQFEKEDSISSINKDLEETEIQDLDQQLQEIEQDLNNL